MIPCGNVLQFGALAQLGERLHGMQEVVSSNLIGSIASGDSEVSSKARVTDEAALAAFFVALVSASLFGPSVCSASMAPDPSPIWAGSSVSSVTDRAHLGNGKE